MGQVLSGRSVTGEGGAHGIPVLTLNYRPLMDCWGGEATVFSCEITDEPPGSRGHQDGPGRTQRGTDRTKRNDGGKRLAGEGRDGWGGREGYQRGCGGSRRTHYILV